MEEVSITHEGETYEGAYSNKDGIMTVTYDGDKKSREIGDDSGHPLELAKVILGEMVKTAQS
ncbi:hypothetical protein [Roseovarius arcticus]|uniref:hypothetical protein n=1 Tax=Roseovarius arcticus TaxID=2547404 RepID=UPI0011101F33|nr:hypothetical protein [Roseovarius arcticus]